MLTKEETILEKEIERGEWILVPNLNAEIRKYRKYARNTLSKKEKIQRVPTTERITNVKPCI